MFRAGLYVGLGAFGIVAATLVSSGSFAGRGGGAIEPGCRAELAEELEVTRDKLPVLSIVDETFMELAVLSEDRRLSPFVDG